MDILAWVIIGTIFGLLASTIVKATNEDALTDFSLGILGALVGGIILSIFGRPGIASLSIYSIIVATLGAIILIWLGRTLKHI